MTYYLIIAICWKVGIPACGTVVLPERYRDIESCSKAGTNERHSGGGQLVGWRCQSVGK